MNYNFLKIMACAQGLIDIAERNEILVAFRLRLDFHLQTHGKISETELAHWKTEPSLAKIFNSSSKYQAEEILDELTTMYGRVERIVAGTKTPKIIDIQYLFKRGFHDIVVNNFAPKDYVRQVIELKINHLVVLDFILNLTDSSEDDLFEGDSDLDLKDLMIDAVKANNLEIIDRLITLGVVPNENYSRSVGMCGNPDLIPKFNLTSKKALENCVKGALDRDNADIIRYILSLPVSNASVCPVEMLIWAMSREENTPADCIEAILQHQDIDIAHQIFENPETVEMAYRVFYRGNPKALRLISDNLARHN